MKKHLKTFIFTALACTLLLGAGISAEAAEKVSKVAINDENFAWAGAKSGHHRRILQAGRG